MLGDEIIINCPKYIDIFNVYQLLRIHNFFRGQSIIVYAILLMQKDYSITCFVNLLIISMVYLFFFSSTKRLRLKKG